ncbi:hypothetical protein CVT26_006876 [Gymnopilus dilepis]|uniref:CENP-V/GFA domain-containing protein n=1 Tax=Gymnopilus dilepis TaxID=231916 RepID=A0A409W0T6_9AGAR|nr:hypothetical protein CVT26_006876 [Gymnopilus dilepis]
MSSPSTSSDKVAKVRNGSCLCGSVRYTVAGDPITFRVCHCQNCRKATGSAFMTNTFFREDKVCITEGEELLSIYPDQATWNGATLNRYFCSHCGSNVFLRSTDKAAVEHRIFIIALGTLDDDVDWVYPLKTTRLLLGIPPTPHATHRKNHRLPASQPVQFPALFSFGQMGSVYPNDTFLQLIDGLLFNVNLSKFYLDIIFWDFKAENIQLVGQEIWRLAETANTLKYFVKTKNYFTDVRWMGSETTSLLDDLTTVEALRLMQRTKKLLVQQRTTLLEDRARPNKNIARWNNFELILPDLETEKTPLYWQYSGKTSLSNTSETSTPTWALDEPIYRCLARGDDLEGTYYDIEYPEDGLYNFYSIYQRPDDYLEHGQMHAELFCH